jgi:hypothetical protein
MVQKLRKATGERERDPNHILALLETFKFKKLAPLTKLAPLKFFKLEYVFFKFNLRKRKTKAI